MDGRSDDFPSICSAWSTTSRPMSLETPFYGLCGPHVRRALRSRCSRHRLVDHEPSHEPSNSVLWIVRPSCTKSRVPSKEGQVICFLFGLLLQLQPVNSNPNPNPNPTSAHGAVAGEATASSILHQRPSRCARPPSHHTACGPDHTTLSSHAGPPPWREAKKRARLLFFFSPTCACFLFQPVSMYYLSRTLMLPQSY